MCSATQVALATVGEGAITGPLASHGETCGACRDDVVTWRKQYEALSHLADDVYRAPGDLAARVTESLGPVALVSDAPHRDRRVPVAAAAAVAVAGTAVLYRLYRQHAA